MAGHDGRGVGVRNCMAAAAAEAVRSSWAGDVHSGGRAARCNARSHVRGYVRACNYRHGSFLLALKTQKRLK
jgi:hypothetical protein